MEDRATKFRKFLEQLPRLCSPTICGTLSQPLTKSERSSSKNESKFEWSLEQKAILSPANITTATCSDIGEQLDHSFLHQESEQFFSQKTIAPSPMTTPSTRAYSRSQPAGPQRFHHNHHMMFDERDEDDTDDEEGEDDDDDDGTSESGQSNSGSDTDIDMEVLHDDELDLDADVDDDDDGENVQPRPHKKNRDRPVHDQTSDSDGNDTDHYEMTDSNYEDCLNSQQLQTQRPCQRQSQARQHQQQDDEYLDSDDDDDDDEDDDDDNDDEQEEESDAEMRTSSHHQDMDSLFLSPPLRSSQTQQRVDIFSPETFGRVMDDENTLQSTPKTIGVSQIFRTRTRRGSEMSD